MENKTFGLTIKTSGDYIKEMQDLAGCNFPIEISVIAGKIFKINYKTEWQEGGTTPVKNKKGEIVDYKPAYESKNLNKEQIKKIDDYIQKNIMA